MNNLKDFIVKNLIVITIAAIIGGAIGSYLNYYFSNLSTENRNKEITKQLMLFVHNDIYKNYITITQLSGYGDILLSVEGLEIINLRGGDLTIKDEQLSFLIRMYVHFSVLNSRMNELRKAQSKQEFVREEISKDVNEWWDICSREIEEYEEKFCKNKSLKSEIEAE